jgi:hypothetical protein
MKNVSRVIVVSRPLRTLRAVSQHGGRFVYFFVVFQLMATMALLIGHFAVVVKNQLARGR